MLRGGTIRDTPVMISEELYNKLMRDHAILAELRVRMSEDCDYFKNTLKTIEEDEVEE